MAIYKSKAVAVTVGTTRVQLQASEVGAIKFGVMIQADKANSGNVFIGDDTVTTSIGIELDAGESISLADIGVAKGIHEWDLTKIYAIADGAAQKIRVIYPELVRV
jgi:hypothetical protein